jgi:hypothetical protein
MSIEDQGIGMSGLAVAFKKAGVTAKNPRWSWSNGSGDGKVVVMTRLREVFFNV